MQMQTLRGGCQVLSSLLGEEWEEFAADRSVGGMTLGEEAAVVGECSLLKRGLGIF